MAIRLHALTSLVLADLGLTTLFEVTHDESVVLAVNMNSGQSLEWRDVCCCGSVESEMSGGAGF